MKKSNLIKLSGWAFMGMVSEYKNKKKSEAQAMDEAGLVETSDEEWLKDLKKNYPKGDYAKWRKLLED